MSGSPSPIFIVGSPRSGTSILTWCLGQHPNILPLEETGWFGLLAMDLHSLYATGVARGERSQLSAMGVTPQEFYEEFGRVVDGLIRGHRNRLEELSRAVAIQHPEQAHDAFQISRSAAEPKRRWVDGTPEYSFYIPGLLRLFPAAKFIHIVRDVGSVVKSLTHFAPGLGYVLVEGEQAAYDYWLRAAGACLEAERAYGSSVILRLRYEDLINSPHATLERCLQFLGETFVDKCLLPLQVRINSSRASDAYILNSAGVSRSTQEAAERLTSTLLDPNMPRYPYSQADADALHRSFSRRSGYLRGLELKMEEVLRLLARAERELVTLRPATLQERVREAVRVLPYDASVIVISKGDEELLKLGGRTAYHFPQGEDGVYVGYYPGDGVEAVAQLRAIRRSGGKFLLVPAPAYWWLGHYGELRQYLETQSSLTLCREDDCLIFDLAGPVTDASRAEVNTAIQSVLTRERVRAEHDSPITFRCNICGQTTDTIVGRLGREVPSCKHCGSTARFRSVIHVLSTELFGRSIALPDFPRDPDVKGIGMTDWEGYAVPLARKLSYLNTFYHREPRLDITQIAPAQEGAADFVISSDVFEHVPPPVSVAFVNMRRLLRPGGLAAITVPYGLAPRTVEHFPELHEYRIDRVGERYVMTNTTREGRVQVFEDLVFHGGPGTTLEMRQFSEASLLSDLAAAGFVDVKVHREPCPEFGVYWDKPWSLPLSARAPKSGGR